MTRRRGPFRSHIFELIFKTFNGGYLQTFATFVVVLKQLVISIHKVNSCGYFGTSLHEELLAQAYNWILLAEIST